MSAIVTLDIFSGRPNPTWKLEDDRLQELLDRTFAIEKLTTAKPSGVLGRLGYRGFSVRTVPDSRFGALSLNVHEGIVDTGQTEPSRISGDPELERWLLDSAGDNVDDDLRSFVAVSIEVPALDIREYSTPYKPGCPPCVAADAPAGITGEGVGRFLGVPHHREETFDEGPFELECLAELGGHERMHAPNDRPTGEEVDPSPFQFSGARRG